ncbi:hypothetical protein, partial [Escherichia coli]|nr:hypothetical protein [Escherichia coli]
ALDPARVAAAQRLLAVMMPPEQRARLMEGIIRPMMANMRQSLQQMPGFTDMLGKDAKAASAMERFLQKQEDRMAETLHAGMPGMVDAMARA